MCSWNCNFHAVKKKNIWEFFFDKNTNIYFLFIVPIILCPQNQTIFTINNKIGSIGSRKWKEGSRTSTEPTHKLPGVIRTLTFGYRPTDRGPIRTRHWLASMHASPGLFSAAEVNPLFKATTLQNKHGFDYSDACSCLFDMERARK